MNIFLSYSRKDHAIADELAVGLRQEGHEVFLDRDNLPVAEAFHARIRDAIAACDLFVFLITTDSVRPESYARTELDLARKRWPDPTGHVVPVLARPTPADQIPAYAVAVNFVQGGNAVAATLGAVASINEGRVVAKARRRAERARLVLGGIAFVGVAGAILWYFRAAAVMPGACYLSFRVQGSTPSGWVLDTIYERETNSFLLDEEGAASIHVGPLRTTDASWFFELRSATGEAISRQQVQGCPMKAASFSLTRDLNVTVAPR